jgi:hypothetical protein
MRALNISISDLEFNKFEIPKENLTFTELVDIISCIFRGILTTYSDAY